MSELKWSKVDIRLWEPQEHVIILKEKLTLVSAAANEHMQKTVLYHVFKAFMKSMIKYVKKTNSEVSYHEIMQSVQKLLKTQKKKFQTLKNDMIIIKHTVQSLLITVLTSEKQVTQTWAMTAASADPLSSQSCSK